MYDYTLLLTQLQIQIAKCKCQSEGASFKISDLIASRIELSSLVKIPNKDLDDQSDIASPPSTDDFSYQY